MIPIAAQKVSFSDILGQHLMDLVKEACGGSYRQEEYYRDGQTLYVIGRSSRSPSADNVIASSDDLTPLLIDPTRHYSGSVSVINTEWPGVKNAVNYDNSHVIHDVKVFAAALQTKIDELEALRQQTGR